MESSHGDPGARAADSKNVACQDLISSRPRNHGWLRRRSAIQRGVQGTGIGRRLSFMNRLPWLQRYVILHHGTLYTFADETARHAHKAIQLIHYCKCSDAPEAKSKDILWPFKVEPCKTAYPGLHAQYFCATSSDLVKQWLSAIRSEMNSARADQRPCRCDEGETQGLEHIDEYGDDEGRDVYEIIPEPGSSAADSAMWDGSPEEASRVMAHSLHDNGVFLIRRSADNSSHTLMVSLDSKITKFKITENHQTRKWYLTESVQFNSLSELIDHYTANNLPNKSIKLRTPFTRAE